MKQKKKQQTKAQQKEKSSKQQRQKQFLFIGIVTVLLMLMAAYKDKQNHLLTEDGNLLRKEPGAGSQETTMNLEIPELEETVPYPVRIGEREYTIKEREELFQKAQKEIDQTFADKGETLDHISKQVHLSDTLAAGMVSADWSFGNSVVFGADGTIQSDNVSENGTLVQVQVLLHYKSYECLYEFPCYVYPEKIDGKEPLLRRLGQVLTKNSLQNQDNAEQILPQKIGEYTLVWKLPKAHTPLVILILGVVAAVSIVLFEKEQKRRQEELRKKQMQMEYPQMVAKIALLLGAGMSVKQAWVRVCEGYARQRELGNCKHSELYEQMQTTCRQMKDGLGESMAYEQFGERSGMSLYRRFAMLLVQNLQKGNAGLLAAMETEADRAFEERKNNAKRLGEEAGTKLLVPMMIMMAIVIAIVMVPAVITMQI